MTATALKIENLTKDDIRYINERRIEDFDHLEFQEEVEILTNDLINEFKLQGVSIENIHIEDYHGIDVHFEKAFIQHENFVGLTDKEKNDIFNRYSVIRDTDLKLAATNNPISKDEVKEIYNKNMDIALLHILRLSDMQLAKRVFDLETFTIIQTLIHHHSFTFDFTLSNRNSGLYCDYEYKGSSRLLDETFEFLKAMLQLGADELFPELSDYRVLVATKQKEHPHIDSNRFRIESMFHAFINRKIVQPIQEKAKNVVSEMKAEVKQRYKELKSYFYSEEYLLKLIRNPDKQQDLLDYLN